MNSDQEFAEGAYKILTAFMVGIESVKSLEWYYRKNISVIHAIKETDSELYKQLINNFKKAKDEINTDQVRQKSPDKTSEQSRKTIATEEDELKRKERTRLYRTHHPSARFWKR